MEDQIRVYFAKIFVFDFGFFVFVCAILNNACRTARERTHTNLHKH